MQNSSIWFFIQKHLEPISLSQLKLDSRIVYTQRESRIKSN